MQRRTREKEKTWLGDSNFTRVSHSFAAKASLDPEILTEGANRIIRYASSVQYITRSPSSPCVFIYLYSHRPVTHTRAHPNDIHCTARRTKVATATRGTLAPPFFFIASFVSSKFDRCLRRFPRSFSSSSIAIFPIARPSSGGCSPAVLRQGWHYGPTDTSGSFRSEMKLHSRTRACVYVCAYVCIYVCTRTPDDFLRSVI